MESTNRTVVVGFNGEILLHPSYTHYLITTAQSFTLSEQLKNKQLRRDNEENKQQRMIQRFRGKPLYIQLHIQLLESLRFQGDKNRTIFTIYFGDLIISLQIRKISQIYIFEEGRYKNDIVIIKRDNKKKEIIFREEVKFGKQKLIQLQIVNAEQSNDLNLWSLAPVLEVGNQDKSKVMKCKIKNIRLTLRPELKDNIVMNNQIHGEQGPLDSLPTNLIPSLSTFPPYSSPVLSENPLYFCHDMKGGYKQDTNISTSFPHSQMIQSGGNPKSHSYRCLHLAQCSIFNYFSHYFITIPPEHWRRLCSRDKKHCIGTFIIQGDAIKSEDYLTQYTANLLVYFCLKHKFDGYLINIQSKVHSTQKLIQFLNLLSNLLHKYVNNSQLIWYDSISIKSGAVNYQNQLNQHNYVFYKICDGIFLNYWWKQQQLINSLQRYQINKKIYVGNDCFGRGTYAGGKFDICQAVSKIREVQTKIIKNKVDSKLIPTLFAMGYTYQGEAEDSWELWKIREKSMYRGVQMKTMQIKYPMWIFQRKNQNGFSWNQQGQWAVTSFQQCRRSYKIPLKKLSGQNLMIKFLCIVKGTGPNFADTYSVQLQILQEDFSFHKTQTGYQKTSQNQKTVELTLTLDMDIITENTFIKIIQSGKDAQKWGGHYGSRFKSDTIIIMSYSPQKDWIKQISIPKLSLPYITNFNLGHGNYFHHRGRQLPTNSSYNYLSDMQTPIAYLSNHPFNMSIQYSDAYIGGTSLKVQGTKSFLLGQLKLKNTLIKQLNIDIILKNVEINQNLKDTLNIQLRYGKLIHRGKIIKEQRLQQGWDIYKFSIKFDEEQSKQGDEQNYKIIVVFPNEQCSVLLGQFSVYQQLYRKQENTIQLPHINEMDLSLSELNPPVRPYCFNLRIKTEKDCRLLISMNKAFVCFAYFDELNNREVILQHLLLANTGEGILEIEVLDKWMQYKTIFSKQISVRHLGSNKKLKMI